MTIPDGHARCRYVELGEEWSLSVYSMHANADSTPAHMAGLYLSTRPKWLVDILAVAAVAGQYHHVPKPPPDIIVWFDLDADNNLAGFPHSPTDPRSFDNERF